MPHVLRNMVITRVDLVDNGANQDASGDGAHVLLFKRATSEEEIMPQTEKTLQDMSAEELLKYAEDRDEQIETLEKAAEDTAETLQTLTDKVEELEKAEPAAEPTEPTEEEMLKSMPESVRKMVEQSNERAEKAEKIAKAEREARLNKEYIAKAEELPALQGETSEIAEELRAVDENLEEEVAKRIRAQFTHLNGLVAQSEIFKTLSRRNGVESTATAEVEKLAKEMVDSGRAASMAEARADLFTQDSSLAKRYREEQ